MKAPGPDGFQGIFYQQFWESVKESVNKMVRAFKSRTTLAL